MKRFRWNITVVFILFTIFSHGAFAEGTILSGAFGEVTVYRDRALVTRTANIELTRGEHRLVFERLPGGLLNESVRVRGEGTARVTILGVETERAFPAEPVQARVRELENRISRLKNEVEVIRSGISALEAERELLKSIRVHTGEQMGREISVQQPDTRRWESTLEYLRNKLEENFKLALEREISVKDLQRQIELLERELQQITSPQMRDAKMVTVRVRAEQAGILNLQLSYLTVRASWRPVYEARVTDMDEDVKLIYNAVITQQTGEDWENAVIILSTAQPAVGAQMPALWPWYLNVYRPLRKEAMIMEDAAVMTELRARRAEEAPVEFESAVAEEQMTSMIFRVPGTHTIPSDAAGRQVYINEYSLSGVREYAATPKLNPNAFLRVKTANSTGAFILPGRVNIFLGNDFVGTSTIGYKALDEEFELFLGIDEGIRITREEVSRKVDEGGFLSRRQKTDFAYRIEIENYKQYPVTISVIDHIPVSQHSDIEIRVTGINPRPLEQTEQGIVTWRLEVEPRGKREITYEFWVRHPQDMEISGI